MFDHTKLKVYFNGQFVDFNDAKISVSNTSFCYGTAVFTGIRANFNPKTKKLFIFRPKEHYQRLVNSSKLMMFSNFLNDFTYEKFLKILKDLIKVNNLKEDVYIRASIYFDEVSLNPVFSGYKDSFHAFLFPMGEYIPSNGMKVGVSSYRRISDISIPARLKVNGAYVNTSIAKNEAVLNGFEEAILLDEGNHVVEGSSENIFIIRDRVIYTPPVSSDILEGITRQSILEIAKDLKISVAEREIDRTELYIADEVFMTGTAAKVSPVTEIDHIKISNGGVGKISKILQDEYSKILIGENKKYLSWLEEV